MLSIENSQVFQNEYNSFLKKLEKVGDIREKTEIKKLCESLLIKVKKLDKEHTDLGFTNRISTHSADIRNEITSLRKAIDNKFKQLNL